MSGESSLLSGNLGAGVIKTVSSDGVFCGFGFVFFLPLRVDLVTQTLLLFFFFDFFFFVVVGVILVGFLNSLAPLSFSISAVAAGSGGSCFCVKEESCFCFLGGGSSSSSSSSISVSSILGDLGVGFSVSFEVVGWSDSERDSEADTKASSC